MGGEEQLITTERPESHSKYINNTQVQVLPGR